MNEGHLSCGKSLCFCGYHELVGKLKLQHSAFIILLSQPQKSHEIQKSKSPLIDIVNCRPFASPSLSLTLTSPSLPYAAHTGGEKQERQERHHQHTINLTSLSPYYSFSSSSPPLLLSDVQRRTSGMSRNPHHISTTVCTWDRTYHGM